MANQMTGRIYRIGQTKEIPSKDGSKTYQRRELTLDCTRYDSYTGKKLFENLPTFDFGGERCRELDAYKEGDLVTVSFDLQGMKYEKDGETRYFTSIRGFRIEPYSRAGQASQPQPVESKPAGYAEQPPAAPRQGSLGMDFPSAPPQNPHTADGLPF